MKSQFCIIVISLLIVVLSSSISFCTDTRSYIAECLPGSSCARNSDPPRSNSGSSGGSIYNLNGYDSGDNSPPDAVLNFFDTLRKIQEEQKRRNEEKPRRDEERQEREAERLRLEEERRLLQEQQQRRPVKEENQESAAGQFDIQRNRNEEQSAAQLLADVREDFTPYADSILDSGRSGKAEEFDLQNLSTEQESEEQAPDVPPYWRKLASEVSDAGSRIKDVTHVVTDPLDNIFDKVVDYAAAQRLIPDTDSPSVPGMVGWLKDWVMEEASKKLSDVCADDAIGTVSDNENFNEAASAFKQASNPCKLLSQTFPLFGSRALKGTESYISDSVTALGNVLDASGNEVDSR